MLMGNCSDEKMVVISSTTNEWPQNNIHTDDPNSLNNNKNNMASSTARSIMEKPGQEQLQQQPQQALKCPRCDSSNTKFCYYNNYSLSQPRHFCKACKRYWTRGGTLRNVPVGGGCRKNKRVKRPNSSSSSSSSPSLADHHINGASNNSSSSSPSSLLPSAITGSNPISPQIDHHLSPLFYGLANNNVASEHHHISLPFSRFMSNVNNTGSAYDLLQPHQLNNNSLGLGFSSSSAINLSSTDHNFNQNGFNNNSSTSLLSSYSSIFSTPSSSPTIASLLASKLTNGGTGLNLKDHLLSRGSTGHFPSLSSPFEELQITGSNGESGMGLIKQVKLEDEQRRLDWNGTTADNCTQNNDIDHHRHHQNIGLSSSSSPDPNSLSYWSTNPTAVSGANWHDPANLGSSVPSLI